MRPEGAGARMAKGSGRMLVIWRAKGGNPPIPGRLSGLSFEPGSERGRSSPGDSRGEFARGQTGSGEVRAAWAGVGSGWRAAERERGTGYGARCPCSGEEAAAVPLCARAAPRGGSAGSTRGNAGGYGGPG